MQEMMPSRDEGVRTGSCVWCGQALPAPEGRGRRPDVHSAVCPRCHGRLNARSRIPVDHLLASNTDPALILDDDHTIGMVNAPGLRFLGKRAEDVLGERAGTALDCENAHLPGGCGATIRCTACDVLEAIAHTHLTGEPRYRTHTDVRVCRADDLTDLRMTFSTSRIADRILLEINHFQS
jgi:hypothetical protein